MVKIEGYISKKAIRRWLENYESLAAGDRPPEAVSTNSGPKAYDGISNAQLNKMMLDQAIENLPDLMKACIKARYIYKLPRKRTLQLLGISDAVYYNRCKLAIDHIYLELNGDLAGIKRLLEKIL
jgi:DNA-directed RNA polymerase specialized sigma subunit